jgi:hypothetical protein
MNTNHTPTIEQLKRGIQIAEQIANLRTEMAAILRGMAPQPAAKAQPSAPAAKVRGGKRRKLSPQALANIVAAQKARWAKFNSAKGKASAPKAGNKAPATAKPAGKKGGLTAAGRARLAAAMKARWAAARKGGGPAPTAKK